MRSRHLYFGCWYKTGARQSGGIGCWCVDYLAIQSVIFCWRSLRTGGSSLSRPSSVDSVTPCSFPQSFRLDQEPSRKNAEVLERRSSLALPILGHSFSLRSLDESVIDSDFRPCIVFPAASHYSRHWGMRILLFDTRTKKRNSSADRKRFRSCATMKRIVITSSRADDHPRGFPDCHVRQSR